jgi:hypothetical protein
MAIRSGKIMHLCLLTGGTTPAGFATTITGSYEIDTGLVVSRGVGGQRIAQRGIVAARIEWEALAPLKSEVVKYFPTTTASELTALTPMMLITDTGHIFKLSNGNGTACSCSVGTDINSAVGWKGTAQFGLVAETTGDPVYLTSLGHLRKHVSATIDTAAAGIGSFEFASGLSVVPDANLDARSLGSENAIQGWLQEDQEPTLSLTLENALDSATIVVEGSTGVYALHDIVIALANGTAGENITVTAADWIAPTYKGELSVGGAKFHAYDLVPGTGADYGRLAVS